MEHNLDTKLHVILEKQIEQNLARLSSRNSSPTSKSQSSSKSIRSTPSQKQQPYRRITPAKSRTMPFENVGEKLYFKGVKLREQTERNLQKIKQQKADN